jgi:hypothetical protein
MYIMIYYHCGHHSLAIIQSNRQSLPCVLSGTPSNNILQEPLWDLKKT